MMNIEIKIRGDRAQLRAGAQKVADAEAIDGKAPDWMIRAMRDLQKNPPTASGDAKRRVRAFRLGVAT